MPSGLTSVGLHSLLARRDAGTIVADLIATRWDDNREFAPRGQSLPPMSSERVRPMDDEFFAIGCNSIIK